MVQEMFGRFDAIFIIISIAFCSANVAQFHFDLMFIHFTSLMSQIAFNSFLDTDMT